MAILVVFALVVAAAAFDEAIARQRFLDRKREFEARRDGGSQI